MTKVTVNNRSQAVRHLLELARKDDLILRTSDGAEFLVSQVDDFDLEIAAQRQNRKLMAYLDKCFREGRRQKGIPLEEVKKRLGIKT